MQITQCNDERRSFRWTIIVISNYPTALSKLLMIFNVGFLCETSRIFHSNHINFYLSFTYALPLNLMDSQSFRIDHLYIKNKVLIRRNWFRFRLIYHSLLLMNAHNKVKPINQSAKFEYLWSMTATFYITRHQC